jgi:membrane dipeptidase
VPIDFTDHRADPGAWARELGISKEAVDLYLSCEVIDLHVDSFIWTRILGYDLLRRHGRGVFGGRFYSQVDLPRLLEARITGAMWSITTHPFRSAPNRARAFTENLNTLRAIFERAKAHARVVRDHAEYRAARARGLHAAMIAIQGGSALDRDVRDLERLEDCVLRVTLVHLTNSSLGPSSVPSATERDLSTKGRAYVEALDARRVFVDLAHIGRRAFFDAVAVHDASLPLIVTHTGVNGAHPSWRNLDDDQLRAIAATGGVVGSVYHGQYLSGRLWSGGRASDIVRHIEHVVKTVGPEVPALGSDWDGLIIPPEDMRTCLELPRLVQAMLDCKFSPELIRGILGENYLRSFARLRPGKPMPEEYFVPKDARVQAYWAAFCAAHGVDPATPYQAWHFGDSAELAHELVELVVNGPKRATAGLGWAHDHNPALAPVLGGYNVLTEYDGTPRAVTRTTFVGRCALNEVDAQFAWDEGEGDRSLEWWRNAHWEYFTAECASLGREPSWQMPVVLERFELLWVGPASDTAGRDETLRGFAG